MDSVEMIALAAAGGVIVLAIAVVFARPVLTRSRHGPEHRDEPSYVTGSGASDGD
jgi:hypothetical protein